MAVDCRLRFGARPSSRIKRALRDESTTVFADFFDPETGQNVEVSGVTATVYLPGGATEAPTPTRQGVGVWSVDVTPEFTGNYRVLMACSSPDTASDTIDFRVFAPEPDAGSPPASTAVLTVAGRTGNVTLTAADVGFTRSGTGAVSTGLAAELNRAFHVDQFGAVGDGTTNDRAAIQAALDACNAAGGGVVRIGPKRYRVTGPTNLIVPKGVSLEGEWSNPGELEGRDFTTQRYALLLDGCSISYRTNSAVRNLAVIRYGMATPTSVRTALDLVKSFTGIGLRNDLASGDLNGQDATLENLLILGFEWAIYHDGWPRFDVRNISADCTNGLRLNRCYDIGRFENIHVWQYLTTKFPWSYDSYAVSSFSDNGSGKLRVTLSVSHPLVTGDKANVVTTSGTVLRKRSTVTVISSTVLDFDTVDYSASYTAAGANVWPDVLYRDGDGFNLTRCDGMSFISCFAFGQRTGFRLGDEFQYSQFLNCKYDNLINSSPDETQGIVFEGSPAGARGNSFVNWWNGPAWTAIKSDCVTLAPNRVQGTFNSVTGSTRVMELLNGRLIVGPAEAAYAGTVYVGAGMDELTFIGCHFAPYLTLETEAGLPASVIRADTATRWATGSTLPAAGGISQLTIGQSVVGGGQNTAFQIIGHPTGVAARGAEFSQTNPSAPSGQQTYFRRITDAGTLQYLPGSYALAAFSLTQAGNATFGGTMTITGATSILGGGSLSVGATTADGGANTVLTLRGNPTGVADRGAEFVQTNPAATAGNQSVFRRISSVGTLQYLNGAYSTVIWSITQAGNATLAGTLTAAGATMTGAVALTGGASLSIASTGTATLGDSVAGAGADAPLVVQGHPSGLANRGAQIVQTNPAAPSGQRQWTHRVSSAGAYDMLDGGYIGRFTITQAGAVTIYGGGSLTIGANTAGGGAASALVLRGSPTGTTARGAEIEQENPTAAQSFFLRVNDLGDWNLLPDSYGDAYIIARQSGDVAIGASAMTTSSNAGFAFLPAVSGVPTGTPTGITGHVAVVFDTANNRLYAYLSGVWKPLAFP